MPSVRLNGLRKSFGRLVALQDVSVEFEEGALTSVLGPSGCGKTTTLNLIAGFAEPDRGAIYFGDRAIADPERGIAVPPNRRNLGMVFQSAPQARRESSQAPWSRLGLSHRAVS